MMKNEKNIMPSLFDISWKVDEKTYRADSALSYSTIAKYERTGFNELSHLNDKIESPFLTFGSAVDSIITGGMREFNDRFMSANFPNTPDSIVTIVKAMFKEYKDSYHTMDEVPDDVISRFANMYEYQKNWKSATKIKSIREKGTEYYKLLYLAKGRTIISTDLKKDITNSVNALKNSPTTKFYFAENNPFDRNINRFYQLKFKWVEPASGITYRCMADEIIVNHKDKIVYPVDLKTSSHAEWDFWQSFLKWDYQIQARLYWRGIRQTMDADPYFKDFKLANYDFIVVNKKTLTPLVWNFDKTATFGTLVYGKFEKEFRDPYVIGSELHNYLVNQPKTPTGINIKGRNNIMDYINK